MNGKLKVQEACRPFVKKYSELCEISNRLLQSIKEGLSKEGHSKAAVRCFQTFVQDFPTGEEIGRYLALDLGGTNFRVLSVTLERNRKITTEKETYEFPMEKKVGPGEELFDHVAECVEDFCKKHGIDATKAVNIPMGFTFSFPVKQEGLNKGILIKWTKGFHASGVVGKDVVQMLKEAFQRRQFHTSLSPVAILNDTTGTLMSCALTHADVRVGVIIGTGTNACYTEKIENIENFRGDPSKPFMLINLEWGNFGADGKLDDFLTEFDKTLNENSGHVGEQIFEKCASGRYLGEIMRLVIEKLVKEKVLFGGYGSELMSTQYMFKSEYITDIEHDPEGGPYNNTREVLDKMEIKSYDEQDLIDLHYIARVVSDRSAAFVSTGIATVLNKMGFSPVSVGIDGTVYRQHPRYKSLMEENLKCLVKPEIQFKLILSEDGSGQGAAFVAAVLAHATENE